MLLLKWMRGRFYEQRVQANRFSAVGGLMARLHAHAISWEPPDGFSRRRWDWDGLFGDGGGLTLSGRAVWDLLPSRYRDPFWAVAQQMKGAMEGLGWEPDAFGLIHGDLHLGNVLLWRGQARPIDFDDCGYANWVYDFAGALDCDAVGDSWRRCRDALIDGYARRRAIPRGVPEHLDLFVAGRQVSLMLWAVDVAKVNARFARNLGDWLDWAGLRVASYLDGCA